ncbi:MAG: aminotransferase class I/II-fold pyridoxal phosphate-dependent enzyme, partial [Hyphomicrobiales bacterium]
VALQHDDHMKSCTAETIRRRDIMSHDLRAQGYKVARSLGNFIFFDAGYPSTDVAEDLMKRGTIVKPWKQPGYDTFIRVSIGTNHENTKFLKDLDAVLPHHV